MSKKTIMVCGLGGQGSGWTRQIKLHPDWELIGIIDTNTELLENLATVTRGELDEDNGYMSLEDACTFGEKPDAVVIATPIYSHHSLAREALDLGVNVICEKNMASSLQFGKQMVQKALDHPELCTAMGTQYRYNMNVWTAHKFIRSEEKEELIGKIGMIKFEDYGYRGEKRWGWRRFLEDVYLEDMSVHWFDALRYIMGMEYVHVSASAFMPRYSDWHGSSTVLATLALAKPEHYNDRHNWVWVDFAGDWQKRGPTFDTKEFYGEKGQFKMHDAWGCEIKHYHDPNNTTKFEDDGYLPQPDVENMGTTYTGQLTILEQMSRGIDSNGVQQPGTNFIQGFKSFICSMAARESSQEGRTVNPLKYWNDWLIDLDPRYNFYPNLDK